MDSFRLKVFMAVVEHHSFTKAAEALGISQPAVTKHIRELEAQYKVQLFDRRGGRVYRTDEGITLEMYAESVMNAYRRMDEGMMRLTDKDAGVLSLGASTTLSHYVLPALLARYKTLNPKVKLVLHVGNTSQIKRGVLDGKFDLGFVEGASVNYDLYYTPFMEDELVAVVRADSQLVPEEISASDLLSIPIVLREYGSGTLEVTLNALDNHGFGLHDLNVLAYIESTEGIKLFIKNMDCMGIVSIYSVSRELAMGELRVVEIRDMPLKRQFSMVQLPRQEREQVSKFAKFVLHERIL